MIVQQLAVATIALVLSACSSLSAPPRDNFYRLPSAAKATTTASVTSAAVVVPPLRASGLHGERALVFAHPDGTRLEQYSYHYWIDSPRVLLQQALIERLKSGLGVQAIGEPSAQAEHTVVATIIRFERADDGTTTSAMVELDFDVFNRQSRVPVMSQRYRHSEPLSDDSIAAAAVGIGAASSAVLDQFSNDYRSLRQRVGLAQ